VHPGDPAHPRQDPNVERARLQDLKNNEIETPISAIGAGVGEEFDVSKNRTTRSAVLATCDADVRTPHIRHPVAHLLLPPHARRLR